LLLFPLRRLRLVRLIGGFMAAAQVGAFGLGVIVLGIIVGRAVRARPGTRVARRQHALGLPL
jgi:hypothetical protein